LGHRSIWGGSLKLVIRLAFRTRKAAQLPHTGDGRARVTREPGDEFTPDARAETTSLPVRRHCELEGRA
jgi:hypothetical protein